jgi:hypothetical protein
MKTLRPLLLLGFISVLGCASGPRFIEPFRDISGFNPVEEATRSEHFPKSVHVTLQELETGIGEKRVSWVSSGGNLEYPVGSAPLKVATLGVMSAYSKGRTPYPQGIIYSLESNFETFVEKDFVKHLPKTGAEGFALQLDTDLPFPLDALDRALQLDPREQTFRFVEKWLYKARGTSSMLAITDSEREEFLALLLTNYYSMSVPLIRSHYPGMLVISQPLTLEQIEHRSIKDVTSKYCDVLTLRYPKEKRLKPSELKALSIRLGRPLYFVDVPSALDLSALLPLLGTTRVLGWQWDQSVPHSAEQEEFNSKTESQIQKMLHYLDTHGLPSNY